MATFCLSVRSALVAASSTMDLVKVQEVLNSIYSRPYVSHVILMFGVLNVSRLLYQALSVLLQTFVLPGKSLSKFGSRKGAWAVVTGSTDGIGKEFALQLGKAGFNVLLVARNLELLKNTAEEIEARYHVKAQSHVIDFAKAKAEQYEELTGVLQQFDIGVLVNNVGKGHAMPTYLVDMPQEEMTDVVAVNVNSTVQVTHAVLPGMVQKKRGLILNIGSFAGAIPSPMLAPYSATKAFMATFTSALAEEVRQHNVMVEHINTYFVVSKLSKIHKASTFIPTPEAYVRAVLSKVGLPCGAALSGRPNTSTPYWSHALLDWAVTLVGMPALFISYSHRLHKDIRRRVLRKAEREGKRV
ncbi:hypothetical protein Ac2012v2_004724 [Leucoagaricus gongylophorus]